MTATIRNGYRTSPRMGLLGRDDGGGQFMGKSNGMEDGMDDRRERQREKEGKKKKKS